MRYPEPILATKPIEDGGRVTARYETPETARMMESLRTLATGISLACLIGAALWVLSRASLSNHAWLLGVATAVVCATIVSQVLADALHRRRFFARRVTDTTLVVDFYRRKIAHAGVDYPRGGVLRFTGLPHRAGRHEERDERVKERLISTTYREAHQVWLQHGETFVRLADVSDERGAAVIVRRLQEEDEQVARGTLERGHAAFGGRHLPL